MKFKKVAALFLAGAMCVAAFAGCSKDSSSSSSKAAEKTTDASKEEEKIDAKILVWGPAEDQDDSQGAWLQTTCEKFNKEHPNWNITFEYGTCGEDKAAATVTQDTAAAADVYFFANDQLSTLIDAGAIAKLGGDTADYIKESNSESIVNSVTYDGAIYGIPFTTNTWYMFYNKDIFSADDVKTMEGMLAKGTVSFPLSTAWYNASFYIGNGCTFFGKDGTDNDAPIDLTGDKAVDVTKYLVELAANKNFKNDDQGAGVGGLKEGTVGCAFTGSWDYPAIKEKLGDKLGVATLPTFNLNGKDIQMTAFAGSKAIAVNPNCKNQQVAVSLALYLANADSQKSHYEARNVVPCNTKLLETITDDELVIAQNGVYDNDSVLQPTVAHMGRWWTPAATWGTNIVSGEVTADNAAQKTEDFNKEVNTDAVQ